MRNILIILIVISELTFFSSCKKKEGPPLYGYIRISVIDTLTGLPIKDAIINSSPSGIDNEKTNTNGVLFSGKLDKDNYDISISIHGYISQIKKSVKILVEDKDTVKLNISLKTVSPPILSTDHPSDILLNSANITGEIIDLGDNYLIQHGHCWSTSPNPTVNLNTKTELGKKFSTGSFNSIITNLLLNKTYYIRAYAINSLDTSYSNEVSFSTTSEFIDVRDGKTYHIAQIGSQIWMTENLNFNASNSDCYEDLSSNCNIYGKLYIYQISQNACPTSWHLPTVNEWDTLFNSLGGASVAYNQLIQGGTSGFDVLMSGYKMFDGQYYGKDENAAFWTATEITTSSATGIYFFSNNSSIGKITSDKNSKFSIRCIKN